MIVGGASRASGHLAKNHQSRGGRFHTCRDLARDAPQVGLSHVHPITQS